MISIIIPVYNEEEQISDLLAHLPQGQSREILVVDDFSETMEKRGIIKTTLINWLITIGFLLHVHPDTLKKLYPDVR